MVFQDMICALKIAHLRRLKKIERRGKRYQVNHQNIKMATGIVARMLMECLTKENYRKSITGLLPCSMGDYQWFVDSTRAEKYHLDTSMFLNRGTINPNGLFDLFGNFSQDNAYEVRENMINMVLTCKDEFASVCWVPLKVQKKNIDEWIAVMTLNTTPGDEIALFALCKVYFKHAAIVTKYSTWTSIDRIDLDEDELLRKCDVALLYMGPGLFGQLVPKTTVQNPMNILRSIPSTGRQGQRKAMDLSLSTRNTTRGIRQMGRGIGPGRISVRRGRCRGRGIGYAATSNSLIPINTLRGQSSMRRNRSQRVRQRGM